MPALRFAPLALLVLPLFGAAAGLTAPAPPGPADPVAAERFERRVRPLLARACYGCHRGARAAGGLRLDDREALLHGGTRGAAVVPGSPETSLLIRAVQHTDLRLRMPPDGRLAPAEVASLIDWVRQGAPFGTPAPSPVARSRPSLWSFQPVRAVGPPPVRDSAWVRSPIDAFVLARLEARGLRPAPPADARTLIRRATFDLTGLPPSPTEVEDFLRECRAELKRGDAARPGVAPEAYARLVDRLLASPRYGERWGRHWLDVARYGDSNGLDENLTFANAWRYRDYVIAAFNADRPFDQFIAEQLAGDLLTPSGNPAVDRERLVATGFLSVGGKMLAEDDPVKMEMDIVDEQLDTLSRAFMGLTVGCARCHDHKFDPISAADYYGLAGILKSTRTMENFKVVAVWHEHELGSPAERERFARAQADVDQRRRELEERRKAAGAYAQRAPAPAEKAALDALAAELRRAEAALPTPPRAMGVREAAPADLRIHLRGNHLNLGERVPRRFPTRLMVPGTAPPSPTASGRLELARWLTSPRHPLTSRVLANRVWQWHFGEGLVRSPDNFGALGDAPSHPELLDFLAQRLLRGDYGGASGSTEAPWSLKGLHRLLMLSSTYCMSSRFSETGAARDPENRLLWRFPRRRLQAEEIRDSILAVSGDLDLTMGGTLLPLKNREYVTSTANRDTTDYNSPRRAVYLPVVRSSLYDVFTAFDFGDPTVMNGQRASTTVAPQALFMMNGSLVLRQTRRWAEKLLAVEGTDADRAARAVTAAFARPPAPREVERLLDLTRRVEAALRPTVPDAVERRRRAWQSLCRVLFGSSELIFVE